MTSASKRWLDGVGDAVGERLGRRLAHQNAGLARHDGLARAATPVHHDRPSAGLRLSGTMPKSSSPGNSVTPRARVELAQLVIGNPAEERHRGAGQTLEPRPIGAVAGNRERDAGDPAGLDGHFNPFVRDQRRDDQGGAFGDLRSGTEEVAVDRRVYHYRHRDYSIGRSCPQHNER